MSSSQRPRRPDVPLQLRPPREQRDTLVIAVGDPSPADDARRNLRPARPAPGHPVATLSQIADLLKKTEQSQRVLDEATEGFALDVVGDEENPDENISIEHLTARSDIAPVIRLVDTTIFTALERRATDIHIETATTRKWS